MRGWIVCGVLLLGLRLMLPSVVKWKINKTLHELPDYQGHLGGVHLALWRGGSTLTDLQIDHKAGDFSLTIKQLALRIRWPHLFKRRLVGRVSVVSPRLRMLVSKPLEAPKIAATKAHDVNKDVIQKTGKSLPDLLASLIPFQIEDFHLEDGTIRLQESGQNLKALEEKDKAAAKKSEAGRQKEQSLEARATDVTIEAHNLTNQAALSGSRLATASVSARLMDNGRLMMHLKIDPTAPQPAFALSIEMTELPIVELNPLLHWQWGVDAQEGTLAMFSEATAQDGAFKGYVKPFLKGLKMHQDDQDKEKGLGARLKEAVVDIAASVLKNAKTKNVAARVPFEGRFENPHPGIWEAVITILRNAFIKALSPHLDRTIRVGQRDVPASAPVASGT